MWLDPYALHTNMAHTMPPTAADSRWALPHALPMHCSLRDKKFCSLLSVYSNGMRSLTASFQHTHKQTGFPQPLPLLRPPTFLCTVQPDALPLLNRRRVQSCRGHSHSTPPSQPHTRCCTADEDVVGEVGWCVSRWMQEKDMYTVRLLFLAKRRIMQLEGSRTTEMIDERAREQKTANARETKRSTRPQVSSKEAGKQRSLYLGATARVVPDGTVHEQNSEIHCVEKRQEVREPSAAAPEKRRGDLGNVVEVSRESPPA